MQTITAKKREILGKKVDNLRKEGTLPAVVYGRGKKTESISVEEKDFNKLWKDVGESIIISLDLDGDKKGVLIHGVDIDPLKDKPRHVDFYEVDMTRKVEVDVPIEYVGESEVIKAGGVLVKVMHELRVEALPGNLPPNFEINLGELKNIGDAIHISDIATPEGVVLLGNSDDTIVFVEEPRKAEEEVPAEEASLENIERVGDKKKTEEGEEGEKTDENSAEEEEKK